MKSKEAGKYNHNFVKCLIKSQRKKKLHLNEHNFKSFIKYKIVY